MTDCPTLLIYATYRIRPGEEQSFRSLASRMADAARRRDGCTFVDVAEDVDTPGTFRLIEGWRDQAALDAHFSSDAFKAVLNEAGTIGIIDRQVDIYTVSGKQTLALPS